MLRQVIDELQAEKQRLAQEKEQLEHELDAVQTAQAKPQESERLNSLIKTITEEKDRLAGEHAKLKTEFSDAEQQLLALGLEGSVVGFAQMLTQLSPKNVTVS